MAIPDNTFTYLDAYCERAGDPHLLAEPLNAITNLAFIIAAYMGLRLWRTSVGMNWKNSWDIGLLVITLAVIGLGSGAWHIWANAHTLLLDVIPIVIFMNIYLAAAAIRLLGLRWWGAVALLALFQTLNFASEALLPRGFLNGSVMYAPAFLMLFIIYGGSRMKQSPASGLVLKATLLFFVSLTFRTVDTDVCDTLPIGTHFLWHSLNACLLYLLLKALLVEFSLKKR